MAKGSKNKNMVRLSGGKGFVMVNLNLAKVLGDSQAIFFMCLVGQLDQHQDYSTDGVDDEWFKVSAQRIYDATGHTYRKQRLYREKLEGMGFLEFRSPDRYKLDLDFALKITKTPSKKVGIFKAHKGNYKPKRVDKMSTKSEPDGVDKMSTGVDKMSTRELTKCQPLVDKMSTTKNENPEQNPKYKPGFKGGDNKDNKLKDSSFLRKRTKTPTDRISGEIQPVTLLTPHLGTSDCPKKTSANNISYEVDMDSVDIDNLNVRPSPSEPKADEGRQDSAGGAAAEQQPCFGDYHHGRIECQECCDKSNCQQTQDDDFSDFLNTLATEVAKDE